MFQKPPMRIAVKTLALSFPVMIGFAVVLLVVGRILLGQGRALLGQSEKRQMDVEASLIRGKMEAASADLRYMAKSAAMAEWLDDPSPEQVHELAYDFLHLAGEKPIYLQIRLIGVDGMELIRVDVGPDGRALLCDGDRLQSKRNRPYFREAMKLSGEEVYLSPFDLNEENGRVEVPFVPTVRISMPLFDAQGRRGVLVFNLRGDALLEGLKTMGGERGGWSFLLVNEAGYWLVGPTPDHEWGFQIPARAVMTLPHSYPRAWETVRSRDSGRIWTENGLFLFTSIFPRQLVQKSAHRNGEAGLSTELPRETRWVLVARLSESEVGRYASSQHFPLYIAFAVGSLIILAYAFVLAHAHNRLLLAQRKERNQSMALGESVMNLQELIEINDRNIAELREANTRLESVLNAASHVSVVATDLAGVITLFNRGAENMLGYVAEEMVGKHTPEVFHLREEILRREEELTAESGHPVTGFDVLVEIVRREGADSREWTYVRKGGSRIDVELGSTAIRNDVDGITGFLVIAVDVTERNRALRELEGNQARLRSVVETAADGIFTVGTDGVILSVNRAGADIFGYAPEELAGRKVNMLMVEPDRTLHDGYIGRFLETGVGRVVGVSGREVPGRHRDGHEFPLELAISEVRTGSERFFTGILRDITERTRAQEALRQANVALARKQRALDDDLSAAAVIQRSLLPQQRPAGCGFVMDWRFLPSTHVGGDVFNVLSLPGGRLGIYLIDVSGHGPAAAMVTVSISQVLQAGSDFIEENNAPLPPDEVLRRVDRAFPFERFERFCTMFYLTYDPAARVLRSADAGHPPPLLVRDGRPVTRLDAGGTVVGMGEPVPFVSAETAVEPGDVLLLYTDGCTEYENAAGEPYGICRLEAALAGRIGLAPDRILEELLEELDRFGDHAKPDDDISLVCLKFTNDGGKTHG
ncbi:PAS domain S-box protein [Pseudodesulfovibrio sp.]|uniref:PAS domain S-box protein n=1 Tax=Pseudodesulfovibrio sp. TaxID=2035812 RepID=UPI00261752ED|nr:PAS domain S-box protein [Pseudodesulfovibrio sp.]MDD3310764.1 PAS domain S-box protein [Pseudodesulfovibrio sp.]